MGEHADATVSGELVVRNGNQRGKRLALTLPTTILGSTDQCDIAVTGRDVGEVHCLITVTTSGPALRSWFPDATLVNGVPTAAGMLKDGDELQVGPCLFQLSWFAETLVPLTVSEEDFSALRTQAAAVAAQQAMLVEEEWQIREREQALSEQESQLAAVLDERHKKLAAMLHSLHDGREKLRIEREAELARLRKMKANVKPLHCAAKEDRRAARKLLAGAKSRIERESAAARAELAADRLAFDRETRVLVERIAEFEVERARTAASDAETERRLSEAWDMLAEGQRRLHADRRESEELFAELREAADRREVELARREQALDEGQERVEMRVQSLLEESAQLEMRTAHARAALDILEQKRGKLEGGLVAVDVSDSIPLDRKSDKSAAQLLTELQQRDRDLSREKRELVVLKQTIDRREADLVDERMVVAEQAAALAIAQESWTETHTRTLADLESLARAVHAKEVYLDARDRELAAASQRCRQRERELWELRIRLEGWQSTLASHEIAFAADRDRAEAELDSTREHLTKWEAALAGLCRKWAAARKRDRDTVRDEIAKAKAERTRYQTRLADLDRDRRQWLEEAAHVAEQALAVEQTIGELATRQGGDARQATRRVRVLRRRWERRFTQLQKELEVRRETAVAEGLAARERSSELHKQLTEVLERRDTLATEEFAAAADHLAKARTLDERAATLSAEEVRRKRTDRELVQVRAELDRITATVMAADTRILDEGTGAIPLRPVLAAA